MMGLMLLTATAAAAVSAPAAADELYSTSPQPNLPLLQCAPFAEPRDMLPPVPFTEPPIPPCNSDRGGPRLRRGSDGALRVVPPTRGATVTWLWRRQHQGSREETDRLLLESILK